MTLYVAGLRGLLPTFVLIYGFQAACAAVAVPMQTEKYYDLCGSLGFVSATAVSLLLPSLRTRFPTLAWLGSGTASATSASWPPTLATFHPRQLLASALATVWAVRLGSFLFARIHKHGSDPRFDKIKKNPPHFLFAWMMQATWISLTALPIYLVNAIPPAAQPRLGTRLTDYVGLALWLGGMGLEVFADCQKSAWRKGKEGKKHDEPFITRGVWSWSRHPNYFGEVSLWTGQYILSLSSLSAATPMFYPWWITVAAAASPLFEYMLIRYLSGVPMLEKSGDEKYGKDPTWQEYKKNVPVFVPFFGPK
ncbi:DUF1295-domain-containing protein [Tilletiaria anomala UBC 951]|uniref:DUF1295-domain-containing protein n=1 Tax=Tilletiaria anomala (strain ATCC 24038 / CBS 436.72 / UBC 951) TaxID=1037660 RepID=A0A066WGN2_TILAU|nr:DUF1295-domain-containing protein [Tilletiaria anomala UBC 951]KDN52951.1 DUF1295-domain-containing protein [Tilletiaria anomala UBC 951]